MARRLANRRRLSIPKIQLNKTIYEDSEKKIEAYQKKVKDDLYIKHAINKIAEELTYFLLK